MVFQSNLGITCQPGMNGSSGGVRIYSKVYSCEKVLQGSRLKGFPRTMEHIGSRELSESNRRNPQVKQAIILGEELSGRTEVREPKVRVSKIFNPKG